MATNKIAIRNDTAANWESANPTLVEGEEGHETDTGRRKVGDGSTTWNDLPYANGGASQNSDGIVLTIVEDL